MGCVGTKQLTRKFTFLSGILKLVCCRDKQLDAAVSLAVEGMTWREQEKKPVFPPTWVCGSTGMLQWCRYQEDWCSRDGEASVYSSLPQGACR